MKQIRLTMLLSACLLVSQVQAQSSPKSPLPGDAEAFETAMSLYQDCKWAAAYGRLATLATRGHEEAARIALFMRRYGKQLYKSDFDASTEQMERWTQLASLTR